VQTALIVATPHGLTPEPIEALTDSDVGHWEGLDWPTIRERDSDGHWRFLTRPEEFGYPGGESFRDVQERVIPTLDSLLARHAGQAVLIIGHHLVNQTYLAGLLGLTPKQAQHVLLDHCGISVLVHAEGTTTVSTLNAAFHLQGVAA
jgi:alpha-ribazole phosphatase/probable phosphoglycerate mutase